jgi:hypothetical protein
MLKWLFERISMYLANHADPGVVVADKPGGGAREEKQWLAETLQLTNDGTEYVRPGRIVLPIVTADSQHVPHLQLGSGDRCDNGRDRRPQIGTQRCTAAGEADAPSQP